MSVLPSRFHYCVLTWVFPLLYFKNHLKRNKYHKIKRTWLLYWADFRERKESESQRAALALSCTAALCTGTEVTQNKEQNRSTSCSHKQIATEQRMDPPHLINETAFSAPSNLRTTPAHAPQPDPRVTSLRFHFFRLMSQTSPVPFRSGTNELLVGILTLTQAGNWYGNCRARSAALLLHFLKRKKGGGKKALDERHKQQNRTSSV